jgi:hypothetical protein
MHHETIVVLAAVAYLQFKHFLCDFPLQTTYELRNKGRYGHLGGILHAGTHAIGSIPVFLFFPRPLGLAALIILGEFVLHYHIDWVKELLLRRSKWKFADFGFWELLGVDQFLHGITYLGIIWILTRTI